MIIYVHFNCEGRPTNVGTQRDKLLTKSLQYFLLSRWVGFMGRGVLDKICDTNGLVWKCSFSYYLYYICCARTERAVNY